MHLGEFFGPGKVSGSVESALTSSITLLQPNLSRRFATFFNHSEAALYLKLGDTAAYTDFTVKLQSGSFYEVTLPIHTGSVSGIWDAPSGSVMVTEYSNV